MFEDSSSLLQRVCEHLLEDGVDAAIDALSTLPSPPSVRSARRYSSRQLVQLFLRDRFTDRYTGKRLVFPGTLRLLSILFPTQFPHHPNWRVGDSHPAYWQLFPTLDHVVPVSRGGADHPDNWVTTSMARNAAKAGLPLAELGWSLHAPDPGWDGLAPFFLEYTSRNSAVLQHNVVRTWLGALKAAG